MILYQLLGVLEDLWLFGMCHDKRVLCHFIQICHMKNDVLRLFQANCYILYLLQNNVQNILFNPLPQILCFILFSIQVIQVQYRILIMIYVL